MNNTHILCIDADNTLMRAYPSIGTIVKTILKGMRELEVYDVSDIIEKRSSRDREHSSGLKSWLQRNINYSCR